MQPEFPLHLGASMVFRIHWTISQKSTFYLDRRRTDVNSRRSYRWLGREIAIVKPRVIDCLGGTAVKALLGRKVKVLANRSKFLASPLAENVLITVHPSSVLRAPEEDRATAFQALIKDLKRIKNVRR